MTQKCSLEKGSCRYVIAATHHFLFRSMAFSLRKNRLLRRNNDVRQAPPGNLTII
jgi:hypothetical protein